MRRVGRTGPTGHWRSRRQPSAAGRATERSAMTKMALVVFAFVGWSLYLVCLFGTPRRAAPWSGTSAGTRGGILGLDGGAGANSDHSGGDVGVRQPKNSRKEGTPGRRYRQLNMMGFERGDGEGGEWETCRSYEEEKLAPHKKVREQKPWDGYLLHHCFLLRRSCTGRATFPRYLQSVYVRTGTTYCCTCV